MYVVATAWLALLIPLTWGERTDVKETVSDESAEPLLGSGSVNHVEPKGADALHPHRIDGPELDPPVGSPQGKMGEAYS
jgi:hypothetical protein